METVKTAIIDLYGRTMTTHNDVAQLAKLSKRAVHKQKRINRSVALCAISATANLIFIHYIIEEHEKKIEKLNKEIEELKKPKGE